ncbi:MAG TPA: DEAD/DEAH box helicase family protein, partial [Candidatus Polarisedimenticolaceae bacterium]|nr:DEAD/DEAH box helicase family protein [Candidatus Polarisedimenticolaceae bacterium]
TGGGKTLIASHALQIIHDNFNKEQNGAGLVLWLVPSDAIRQQTLNALKDKNHPYREAIDLHFNSNVKVFTVEEALSGITKNDLTDNLCIIVSSLAAFRREDASWLKAFKDNGSLISHFTDLVEDNDFLDKTEDGEVINSLANVIKINRPIVILDEGHNAQTALSFDMFKRMFPSVILELTATPRAESNILVVVHASELKAEKMVKIPIYLTNVSQWQEAIRDGISKRNELEKVAKNELKATKEYIRPIVLIQAEQEKEDEDKVYVDKIKEFLLNDLKIDESEIKIKTAKQDQLVGEDLLSKTSKVNYIITVNALKEGWDCPFAYVLVSASKIGSRVAVEQTIGRILRMPNVKDKKNIELNYSYVYSSSENFSKASSAIVKGLENNGYSKDDLKQLTGPVKSEKGSFNRVFSDKVAIPVISIKGAGTGLAFNKDLIGNGFALNDYYTDFDFDFINDQDASVKIDLNEKDGIVRFVQGKLVLVYNLDDFSEEELTTWLKKNVQNRVVSGEEMAEFIDKTLAHQLKKYSLQELSINRYKLKESISVKVSQTIAGYGKKTFDELLASKKLVVDEVSMDLPSSIVLGRLSPEYFSKHLYEKAGPLNGEETEFAFKLNDLANIEWWYRNREKEDFYLQGWLSSKFYPDFIAKTKGGSYVLVEYKGEDRLSNNDTAWKKQLGELWQQSTGNKHLFYLVGKRDTVSVIKAIENIE